MGVHELLDPNVVESSGTARTPSSNASLDDASLNASKKIGVESSNLGCDLSDAHEVARINSPSEFRRMALHWMSVMSS